MIDVNQLMAEILCQKGCSAEYHNWAKQYNELTQHTRNNVLIYLQEFVEEQPTTHPADLMVYLLSIGVEMGNTFNQWVQQFPRLDLQDRYKVYEGLEDVLYGSSTITVDEKLLGKEEVKPKFQGLGTHDRALIALLDRVNALSRNDQPYELQHIVRWVGNAQPAFLDTLFTAADKIPTDIALSQLELSNAYPSSLSPIWFKLDEVKPVEHNSSGLSKTVLVRIEGKVYMGQASFHKGQYHSLTIHTDFTSPHGLCCYDLDTKLDQVQWTDNPLNSIIETNLPVIDTRRECEKEAQLQES